MRSKRVARPVLSIIAMLTIAPLLAVAILLCCAKDTSALLYPIAEAAYVLRGMALNWLTYISALIVAPVLMRWISASRSFRQFSLQRLLTLSVSAGSNGSSHITNSHRQDLTKLPPSFMGRQLKELLPAGEHLIARINTQPFILDHGDDATDFPGDEFLLRYWLGRHVGAISAPRTSPSSLPARGC
jgi:hypothetical protein